ncbi:MAG: aminoacetone oxidase family FAD-binding enzyme [Eubacterium sp.]|nr:aminoacetone oxidase family FAD-binding enzyme [Eubacterium sp.]
MPQKKILIIGAGASGLMAAIWAARCGAHVTILEGNDRPGRKLLASGNGKCNLTNLTQDPSCYRGTDPQYLWRIIRRFDADQTIAFFTGLGLYPKSRDGWIYPCTEQAETVLKLLLLEAEHLGVRIKTREEVQSVSKAEDCLLVRTKTWAYSADAVIAACGSPASAVRGSSDTALVIAEETGQPYFPFMPALVPLHVRGDYAKKWAGVRIQASVSLVIDNVLQMREEGNVQLADYGISGIPVFQISRFAVRAVREAHQEVQVILDLVPHLSEAELKARLEMQQAAAPWKTVRQLFCGLLPEQLIPVFVQKKADITTAVKAVKQIRLTVTDAASGRFAQVSSGGIATAGLDENLQSRYLPGLYFTGEAVDADGACGGYNLQWAWSSGYVAGTSAAAKKECCTK